MKTNLEELNYRFRKELLNNYGYNLYISLLHYVESETLADTFEYDFWVKGLFKKNGIDDKSLIDSMPYIFDECLDLVDDFWSDIYSRGGNFIDLINVSELVSLWISLYYQFENSNEYFWNTGLRLANSQNSKEYIDFFNIRDNITYDDLDNLNNGIAHAKNREIDKDWVAEFLKLNS